MRAKDLCTNILFLVVSICMKDFLNRFSSLVVCLYNVCEGFLRGKNLLLAITNNFFYCFGHYYNIFRFVIVTRFLDLLKFIRTYQFFVTLMFPSSAFPVLRPKKDVRSMMANHENFSFPLSRILEFKILIGIIWEDSVHGEPEFMWNSCN